MINSRQSAPPALVLALLGGAALGAIALVLTAPKSGREVRSSLRNLVQRFRNRATEDPGDGEVVAVFI
jgi:gas vesicle protein